MDALTPSVTHDPFTDVRAFYTLSTYLIGRKCWRGCDGICCLPSCQEKV